MGIKILPWITGIACLLYIYGWTQDTTYPAWVPLIWCFGCFVNDLYSYLEHKRES
jgi:hypothetical protein